MAIRLHVATANVDITVNEVVAVVEDLVSGLEIYPNPVADIAHLTITMEKENHLELNLIDLAGSSLFNRMVDLQQGSNSLSLDLSEYASGAYMLTLTIDGRTAGMPLIIQ